MTQHTQKITLPSFTPLLIGFRSEEFLALTETLLAFPIEQDRDQLNTAAFHLGTPESQPEAPLPALTPRWYPRPNPDVMTAAHERLMLPPRPAIFEGRTNELARVLRPLLSGHPVRVYGEAGVGKTTLLATVATHERTRQRFRWIRWIDQPDQLEQLLALAQNMQHVIVEPNPETRRKWLADKLDEHTLLIIDNAAPDDLALEHLATLTPHVLIAVETAPEILDPDTPLSEDPEGVVTLRGLNDAAAIDTLAYYAGLNDTRQIRAHLLKIVTSLGHHPYALMLAGALIRRDGVSLDELEDIIALEMPDAAETMEPASLAEELAARENPAVVDDNEIIEVVPVEEAMQTASLNRALDVSIAALPQHYRRLFELFGAFPPGGAPLVGLHALMHDDNLLTTRRGLIMLEEYGFIRRSHYDPDHYTMHPVAYARATVKSPTTQRELSQQLCAWALDYARAYADDPAMVYQVEASLQYVLVQAAEHGPTATYDVLAAALHPGLCERVPGLLATLDNLPPVMITESCQEAANLTRYGVELTNQGAIYAAEEALARALKIRREHDNAHAIAETLVALGRLYDVDGQYTQAAEHLIEAAELVHGLGAESSLSIIRRGLARVYRHLGHLNEGLSILDDAPEAHFERAAILREQGQYAAAVEEMALSGEDEPHTRAGFFLLAEQYAEALAAIAGLDDPLSTYLRAQIYHLQGSIDQAIQGYEIALEQCETDAARTKILQGLGAAWGSAGNYMAARTTLEAALELDRVQKTPDPAFRGRTLRLLAAVYLATKRSAEAITTARDALLQLELVAAPDDTTNAYCTLGRALWESEDYAGAREAFEREAELAQTLLDRDDARIGRTLHHVAAAYAITDELDRAIANYRLALTHKNPTHDPTGYSMTQLALHQVLMADNRLPAALDISQEILEHLARHPETDLMHTGYAHALRARTQQATQRPIRARQSLDEWAAVLTTNADTTANDPRPAVRALILGLATRSLLAEKRPVLALEVAQYGCANAKAHPNTPAAWAAIRDLGEVYLALDRPEDARQTLAPLLSHTVRDHPGQVTTYALAHELTGQACRQLDEPNAALEHLQTAFEHEADDHLKGMIQATIADVYLETGQPTPAVERLQMALPLLSQDEYPDAVAQTLTTLAHTLGGLNRYAEAIGVYEAALIALRAVEDTNPTHTADVLRSLGQTHEAQGQLPEAAQAYRRAINLLERADAPRQNREMLHLLARVTATLGEANAVQLYEQLCEQTEQWSNVEELGIVRRELADVHRNAGRLMLAVQHYQAALTHQPAPLLVRERIGTLRNLGRAYSEIEHYKEARTAWTEALDLSHNLPDSSPEEIGLTHHAIAEAYRHQKEYAKAELSYREALRYQQPGTVALADTHRALGQTYQALGQHDDAVAAWQQALEVEKSQPQQANARIILTLQHLAAIQAAVGNRAAAITHHHAVLVYLDRTLQAVAYTNTLRTLGRLYTERQEYEQAFVALNEALEIENEHIPRSEERISLTLQAIADAYRAAGDLEKAAEYYQKVTAYANLTRRAENDLRETLDELDRRRETLLAAQQSLTLLDRNETTDLKDLAFIYALSAYSQEQLNQPQASATAIHTLLDMLVAHQDELSTQADDGDFRALAWLVTVHQSEQGDDIETAQFACGSALEAVQNKNLRWVIEQVAQSLE